MPREYGAIRDSLKRRGKGDKEAKRIAAATYNKRHPGRPMRPHKHPNRWASPALVLLLCLLSFTGCTTNLSLFQVGGTLPTSTQANGGIPNFYKVDDGIWRGAQPLAPKGFDYLRSIGVKTIYKLNLDTEGSDDYALSLGIMVVHLPVSDWDQIIGPPPVQAMQALVAKMGPGSFVHCGSTERTIGKFYERINSQGGQDRTGLFVYFYRRAHGWSQTKARAEALSIGFHPELHGLNEAMENN